MLTAPSLAARMTAEIAERIVSGAWAPGARIPREQDFMAQYGCSRMTVSKALAGLRARGLIVSRRRAGSFVAAPGADQSVLRIEDLAEQAARSGRTWRHAVARRVLRPLRAAEAEAVGLPAGAPVVDVRCLHELDGVPVAWEQRLISAEAAPEAAGESFAAISPGAWLLRHVPWTDAEHVISALNATAELARRLALAKGAACLRLHRRTWRQGALVTDVRLTYPGARYRFSGRFSPGSAAPPPPG
jgi:GntR family histidine utilization transcriptional repressor